jgi:hypothetical protein
VYEHGLLFRVTHGSDDKKKAKKRAKEAHEEEEILSFWVGGRLCISLSLHLYLFLSFPYSLSLSLSVRVRLLLVRGQTFPATHHCHSRAISPAPTHIQLQVVGRLLEYKKRQTSLRHQVFVCFRDGTAQNVVEMAFKLRFGCP